MKRAVDAGIGPAPLPAVEIRLSDVEPLEAEAAQRRLLGVADGRLDLALAIGIADAAWQGDDAVVGQHVTVERIERGVVDVRGEGAFLEVVEHDDAYGAAQPAERPLVQLGPDLAGALRGHPRVGRSPCADRRYVPMRSGENATSKPLRRSSAAPVLTPPPGRATVMRYTSGPSLPSGMRPGICFVWRSLPSRPSPRQASVPAGVSPAPSVGPRAPPAVGSPAALTKRRRRPPTCFATCHRPARAAATSDSAAVAAARGRRGDRGTSRRSRRAASQASLGGARAEGRREGVWC